MKEEVNHPSRYCGECSIECISVMRLIFGTERVLWFCLMNTFKYLWRYKSKNGEQDIAKAKWYFDYVVNHDGFQSAQLETITERFRENFGDILGLKEDSEECWK